MPDRWPTRVGIFGGSFDPPHVGHLLVAQDALEALPLDRLIVVPAATQPLKPDGNTGAADRLAMVERCFAGIDGVEVDPIEIERGGLSFMVETVEAFRERWPAAELYLLIGEDVLETLPRWRDPLRLLAAARLVILPRDHRQVAPVVRTSASAADARLVQAVQGARRLATRQVDVSSTEIRARVRAGRSIRGFVPDAVQAYIAAAGLYVRSPDLDDVSARA